MSITNERETLLGIFLVRESFDAAVGDSFLVAVFGCLLLGIWTF